MEQAGFEYLREYNNCRIGELPLERIDPAEFPELRLDSGFDWYFDESDQLFAADCDEFGNYCNLFWFPADTGPEDLEHGDGGICCGHWILPHVGQGWAAANPFFQYEENNRPWTM